jgi:hypothetical protein
MNCDFLCAGSFVKIYPLERVWKLIKGRIIDIGTTKAISFEYGQIVYYNPIYIDSTIVFGRNQRYHFVKYYNINGMILPPIERKESTTNRSVNFKGFKDMAF